MQAMSIERDDPNPKLRGSCATSTTNADRLGLRALNGGLLLGPNAHRKSPHWTTHVLRLSRSDGDPIS